MTLYDRKRDASLRTVRDFGSEWSRHITYVEVQCSSQERGIGGNYVIDQMDNCNGDSEFTFPFVMKYTAQQSLEVIRCPVKVVINAKEIDGCDYGNIETYVSLTLGQSIGS